MLPGQGLDEQLKFYSDPAYRRDVLAEHGIDAVIVNGAVLYHRWEPPNNRASKVRRVLD